MSSVTRQGEQSHEEAWPTKDTLDVSRCLAVGSSAVVALIGPPGIGRAHIRDKAIDMFPDFAHLETIEDIPQDDSRDKRPLHLIGVVTEPMVWFHHFSSLYPPHSDERPQRREEAISCLTWMAQQDSDTLGIIYHRPNNAEIAASQVHDHLVRGEAPAEGDRELIGRLLVTAMTIGA